MSKNLSKKELRFLKKYPSFASILNDTTVGEYRLINGMVLKTVRSGVTYTGTNGIKVDNTSNTIGLDDEATSVPELSNLKITGDFVLDKGADFNADSDAELNVYCEATFTNTLDMSTATIQIPSIALTGTSGSLTEAQWSVLQASKVPYVEKDNNKYYYCGRTYDATTATLVRTLTYVCANVGKIVITCNDPVSPATEYTYTWAYTASEPITRSCVYSNNSYVPFDSSSTFVPTSGSYLIELEQISGDDYLANITMYNKTDSQTWAVDEYTLTRTNANFMTVIANALPTLNAKYGTTYTTATYDNFRIIKGLTVGGNESKVYLGNSSAIVDLINVVQSLSNVSLSTWKTISMKVTLS